MRGCILPSLKLQHSKLGAEAPWYQTETGSNNVTVEYYVIACYILEKESRTFIETKRIKLFLQAFNKAAKKSNKM
jgi:NADPH-dependent 7-cyano-7-deazaguanine reductase QueF-like protein